MHAGNLLDRRALLTPDRIALVEMDGGRRYTYAELNRRANRMASFLRHDIGIRKGDRVSILAHNSVTYVDLFYAAGKLGAILAPLNWRLQGAELAYIVNDCAPSALLCGPEFTETLGAIRAEANVEHVVGIDGARISGATSYVYEEAGGGDALDEPPALDAEDTYCLLYTSGTTGRPKGAMIPHRQILWNCINTVASWGLTENDVSPVFTPLFHAGGLFAFLTPLFYIGGRIVLFKTFEAEDILDAILRERCTVVLGVPTIYRILMDTPGFDEADFGHVRFFISGGAPLPVELARDWIAAKGGVFRQGYGLTEVGANCFTMTDEESVRKVGSVGKPIFHSEMRLADESGTDVAAGETGELLIAGPHVCTGYWHNPEASRAALVDGWFHTGDMARRDADGVYTICGRFKDMIISGGENVYAAEVESVFREHAAVADAALIGMPDPKWQEVGLMIVVLKKGAAAAEEELRTFCGERLARYKVPKRVLFVDALPYSAYGKVMKNVLRTKYAAQTDPSLKEGGGPCTSATA
jgi:fatty-acyl-CoA synthase